MLRGIFFSCIAIMLIACNDSKEIKADLPQESPDTTEEVKVIKPCRFISSRKGMVSLDSLSILPTESYFTPDTSHILSEDDYNQYLKNSGHFDETYTDFKWITAVKANDISDNVLLLSYIKNDELKDKDAFIIAFSEDCKILDMVLISSFRKFNGGSTQKSAYIESDTITVGTAVSSRGDYSAEETSDITYRSFYFDEKLQVFMIVE